MTVFIDVRLRPGTDGDAFETTDPRLSGITELRTAHATPEYDYLPR